MRSSFWSKLRRYALGGVAVGIFTSGTVLAQDASPDIKARLDALEKKNQELEQKLQERQTAAAVAPEDPKSVEKIVTDLLKAKEEEQKRKDAEKKLADEAQKAADDAAAKANGYEVGSALGMTGRWGPNGLMFETANGDFMTHIGGRFDYDTVFWNEPYFLQASGPGGVTNGSLGVAQRASRINQPTVTRANGPSIANLTGVGVLDDGEFFRRVRLRDEGRAYDVFEWLVEVDFENINSIVFDNLFAGVRDIPFLGTIRVGQHKVPQGLESFSSSMYLEMLERSSLFSTFWQEFGGGLFMSNSIFDQRVTWAYQYARPTTLLVPNAVNFGDGVSMNTARLTVLPIYADDGRELLHLGISAQHKTGDIANNQDTATFPGDADIATSYPANNVKVVRFRSTYDIRDAIGQGQNGSVTGNGIANLSAGDGARAIDSGALRAPNGSNNIAGELLGYFGPFYVQAEANLAYTPGASYAAYYTANPATGALTPARAPNGYSPPGHNLVYSGYYVQGGYFLTGENRGYDRRFGLYERVRPNENFFFTRDANGRPQFGMGAWEILYRYDFINLDSKGIDGGRLGQNTFGLNWYLNPHMKIAVNFLIADQDFNKLIPSPAGNVPPKTLIYSNIVSGQVEGLGLRMHLDF